MKLLACSGKHDVLYYSHCMLRVIVLVSSFGILFVASALARNILLFWKTVGAGDKVVISVDKWISSGRRS